MMKKYLMLIYSLLATLFLSACGSSGGGGDTQSGEISLSNENAVELVKAEDIYYASVNTVKSGSEVKSFTLTVRYKKNLSNNYNVEVENTAIDIVGCEVSEVTFSPNPVVLNGNGDSSMPLIVAGKVDAECENKIDYVLSGVTKITLNGKTQTEPFVAKSMSTGYRFVNNNPPMNISYPSQIKKIEMQVMANNGPLTSITACEPNDNNLSALQNCVLVGNLPREFGKIRLAPGCTEGTCSDDNLGYLTFEYISPVTSEMPKEDKKYKMYFYYIDGEGTIAAQTNVKINMQPKGPFPGYALANATTPIVVTQPNTNKIISVQLVNNGLPVLPVRPCTISKDRANSSETVVSDCVIPESLPKEFGRINNIVWNQQDDGDVDVTDGINDNGYIRFEYVGPDSNDIPEDRKEHDMHIYYVDAEGNRVASTTIKVIIDAKIKFGPVSTLSLTYNNTQCLDEDQDITNGNTNYGSPDGRMAKMVFTVQAVDSHGNPAKGGVTLIPSIINGVKVVSRKNPSGELKPGSYATFIDPRGSFTGSGVTNEDSLAILPDAQNYNSGYLGRWDIDNVTSRTLFLDEKYSGKTVTGLAYVVGNERRYIPGFGVATANISRSGKETSDDYGVTKTNYVTNEDGIMTFEVIYDYKLAGRTFTLSVVSNDVDANGEVVRAGISKVDAFRWPGGSASGPGGYGSTEPEVPNDGQTHKVQMSLYVNQCDGSQPIEALSGVNIVPGSITVKPDVEDPLSGKQCSIDQANSNFISDINGNIEIAIVTKGTAGTITMNCIANWTSDGGSIYLEY
ncbi:hypothetical protein [Sulfurovum sp. NBC37-1]|uniref:hypothetical protein n=1 Tax=Sulfurovum sp. (strain NBC37-1) TaxID=387093 RepID=UPI0001587D25|nr:hypothetical protein [Sulfurovum sp. NBC37-1]BAF72902.1 hypothetical protein SUN_1958 [Sulfurovum sp. NBC37-1]